MNLNQKDLQDLNEIEIIKSKVILTEADKKEIKKIQNRIRNRKYTQKNKDEINDRRRNTRKKEREILNIIKNFKKI